MLRYTLALIPFLCLSQTHEYGRKSQSDIHYQPRFTQKSWKPKTFKIPGCEDMQICVGVAHDSLTDKPLLPNVKIEPERLITCYADKGKCPIADECFWQRNDIRVSNLGSQNSKPSQYPFIVHLDNDRCRMKRVCFGISDIGILMGCSPNENECPSLNACNSLQFSEPKLQAEGKSTKKSTKHL